MGIARIPLCEVRPAPHVYTPGKKEDLFAVRPVLNLIATHPGRTVSNQTFDFPDEWAAQFLFSDSVQICL